MATDSGFTEITNSDAKQELEEKINMNAVNLELTEHLLQKDRQNKLLETQIIALKSQIETNGTSSIDQTKLATIQEKLTKAVSHLRFLSEENVRLNAQIEGLKSESRDKDALSNEIEQLKQHINRGEEETKTKDCTDENIKLKALIMKMETDLLHANQVIANESEHLNQKNIQLHHLNEKLKSDFDELDVQRLTEIQQLKQTHVDEKERTIKKFEQEIENMILINKQNEEISLENANLLLAKIEDLKMAQEKDQNSYPEKVPEIKTSSGTIDENDLAFLMDAIDAILTSDSERQEQAAELVPSYITLIRKVESAFTKTMKELVSRNSEITSISHELESLKSEKEILVNEKVKYLSDNTMLMDRLTTMKNSIAPRLQAEIAESTNLRKQNAQLVDENDALRESLDKQKETHKKIKVDDNSSHFSVTMLQAELGTLQETYQKTQREIQRLRLHLIETEEISTQEGLKQEEVIKEFRLQIFSLANEKDQWQSVMEQDREQLRIFRNQFEEMENMLDLTKEENESLKTQIQRHSTALANLQTVLAEFQNSRDSEIANVKTTLTNQNNLLTIELDEIKKTLGAVEELSKTNKTEPDVEKLKLELNDRNILLGKLRHDVIQYKAHLSEAMRRMTAEDGVDRRLISNLLIQYICAQRGEKTRYEMLDVISNILKFTDEEKYKCGISRSSFKSNVASPSDVVNESFSDMWISFLMKETSNPDLIMSPTTQDSFDFGRQNNTIVPDGPRIEYVANSTTESKTGKQTSFSFLGFGKSES